MRTIQKGKPECSVPPGLMSPGADVSSEVQLPGKLDPPIIPPWSSLKSRRFPKLTAPYQL
jgi:hypothetical protein